MPTIPSDGSIEIQVVGAIRLALEAAADDRAAVELTKWLVSYVPLASVPGDLGSVSLLMEGIRQLGFSLSTESPSGAAAA